MRIKEINNIILSLLSNLGDITYHKGVNRASEWELGIKVALKLASLNSKYVDFVEGERDEVMMLADIPVRINVVDPWCIKLWNEVTL